MFLDKITYTAEDVRYTRKGNDVYAIFLGWPGDSKVITLTSFSKEVWGEKPPQINAVLILGYEGNINYQLKDDGLQITTPPTVVDEKAFVLKISLTQ